MKLKTAYWVDKAINCLSFKCRKGKGVSLIKIKRFIKDDLQRNGIHKNIKNYLINKYLLKAVDAGHIVRVSGYGANGSFRMAKKKRRIIPKKNIKRLKDARKDQRNPRRHLSSSVPEPYTSFMDCTNISNKFNQCNVISSITQSPFGYTHQQATYFLGNTNSFGISGSYVAQNPISLIPQMQTNYNVEDRRMDQDVVFGSQVLTSPSLETMEEDIDMDILEDANQTIGVQLTADNQTLFENYNDYILQHFGSSMCMDTESNVSSTDSSSIENLTSEESN